MSKMSTTVDVLNSFKLRFSSNELPTNRIFIKLFKTATDKIHAFSARQYIRLTLFHQNIIGSYRKGKNVNQ